MTTVSAVADRIDYLLLTEGAPVRCVGDLREKIMQLRSELDKIVKVLTDEQVMKNMSTHEDFRKQKTQLAYDIEDAVESYVAAHSAKSKVVRCFSDCSTAARRLREDLHIFTRRIDGLRHFLDAAAAVGDSTTFVADPQTHRQVVPETSRVNRGPDSTMEHDVQRVEAFLLNKEVDKLSIIAIIGMGGLGKTTLAKYLYNDILLVNNHFDSRAWVVVGHDFQARDILESILFSISSGGRSKDEIAHMETMELMDRLYKAQKGRRYLVVLDDVWSTEAWDAIKIAFPDDNNGSRVIITTRNFQVARGIATYVHEMMLLSAENAWELLRWKSGVDDLGVQFNPEMEAIGRQIVVQCRGLPLAIVVVAGILRGKNVEDWNMVMHTLQREQNSNPVVEILRLSYNHLPFHLKPCFLFLGHFPEDHVIPVEKLYLLWMAEGLIPRTSDSNFRERMYVAEDYLKELAKRSLVNYVSGNKRNHSCMIHDLLRDLCISIGEKEDFFEIIDLGWGNIVSSLTTRRAAIYLGMHKDRNEVFINITEPKHVRSILFFDAGGESLTLPIEFFDFKEFQWTRLLDFDGVDFRVKKLPRGIEKLIYLRYLSFQGCHLQELPSSFNNFPFLETLDLRVRVSCIMTIPNVLRKLSSLRHLYFPPAYRTDTKDKLKLDSLKKLEILENFHTSICEADDLLQLENLQIFTGIVDGNNTDLQKIINFMNQNKRLHEPSLVVKNFDSYSEKRFSIVAELLKCNGLHSLDIEGYLVKLPPHEAFGSNLTKIVFNGSEFTEDPMRILGELPNLESLVLCNDAFVGEEMVCPKDGFRRLTSLKLATLQYLEEWEMGSSCMQELTTLTIEQCDKLIKLPYQKLREIRALEKLMIGSMRKGFQDKVNELIEERENLGMYGLTATFYDC